MDFNDEGQPDESLTPVTVHQWELKHGIAQGSEQLRALLSGILHQLLHIKTIPGELRATKAIR